MATPRNLDLLIRQSVAEQIAERLPVGPRALTGEDGSSLGESLRIMMLPYDALGSAEKALEERVIDTGQWHHQIYVGDDPVSFARSVEKSNAGEPRHEVVEVSQSPLPTALRKTIDWVDANLPKEGTADVLLIPAYALAALWIHGDGQDFVVIAARAPKLRMLPLNRAIPAADFVRRLAENKPIEGMGPVPGADDAR